MNSNSETKQAGTISMTVTRGAQAATSHQLAEGDYRLGSDISCDIILMDPDIAGQHATLTIKDNKVQFTDLIGAIAIGDLQVESDGTEVPFEMPINLGSTEIIFTAPEVQAEEKVPTISPEETAPKPAAEKPRAFGQWIKSATYGGLTATLLAGLVMFVPETAGLVSGTALSAPAPKTVERLPEPIMAAAPEITPLDRALDSVQDIIRAFSFPLDARIDEDSRIKVSGILADDSDRTRLVGVFASDLPDPSRVDIAAVLTRAQVLDIYKNQLSREGLGNHLKPAFKDGRLNLEGDVPPALSASWERTRVAIADNLPLEVTPVMTGLADKPTGLRISAIWSGTSPYVVLQDGQIYTTGAILPNGWTIKNISSMGLSLSRDGKTSELSISPAPANAG